MSIYKHKRMKNNKNRNIYIGFLNLFTIYIVLNITKYEKKLYVIKQIIMLYSSKDLILLTYQHTIIPMSQRTIH